MKNIVFQALADAAQASEPVALGIITGVKGSSPQKVGAKALFYGDGRIKGTLGGGCLEAEIQQRAIQSLSTGEASTFDLLLDHDFGWDDGLICGGKVFGVILPNAQRMGQTFWSELALRQATLQWNVTTDLRITRATPLLMESEAVPLSSQGAADEVSVSKQPWKRRGEEANIYSRPESVLYRETVTPPCALWIAGAGHIAQAVAPLALQLDFNVTVFDDRPTLASPAYFPKEVSLKADTWEKLLALPFPQVPSFALIVTRGHRHDALVLKDWVHLPFRFLGMIGSARKARTIFEHFLEEKIATPDELKRVSCPVGINIPAQSVPEIAVSIMAQYIEKRADLLAEQRSGSSGKSQLV